MKLKEIELRTIHLPLVRPFRTSFGTQTSREVLIVKVTNENGTAGWAECVAMSEPLYSPEYVVGCIDLIKIPADIVAIRLKDREENLRWRRKVREQFLQSFEKGGQVVGFSTNSEYVVRI